jgi:hypothetical protein
MGLFDKVAPKTETGASSMETYTALFGRCRKLELTQDWLKTRLMELGAKPVESALGTVIAIQGLTQEVITKIDSVLTDFESKVQEVNEGSDPKKRKPRTVKAKAAIEEDNGLEAIYQWAEAAGLTRAEVLTQWGGEKDLVKLKEKLAQTIKGRTNQETGEVIVATAPNENQGSNSVCVGNGIEVGQPIDPEVQEMLDEVRKKLGVSFGNAPGGEEGRLSKAQAETILRQRMLLLQELHYIVGRYYQLRTVLNNKIEAIDLNWRIPLEQFFDSNKPEGKKSIDLMYGTVGKRNTAFSIAVDPINQDQYNNWIAAQSEEFKQKYHVVPVKSYRWDWGVYKSEATENYKANNVMPKIPGTIVTPPQENVFFIGPSLDTVTKKAKEGKEI